MRKYLLAGAAAFVVAVPAAATTDHAPYVGVEGGVMWPKSQTISGTIDFTDPTFTDVASTTVARQRYKMGWDVDLIGGFDLGMFRLEGELGYKRAKNKNVTVNDAFVTALNTGAGTDFVATDFDLGGHTSV